jgi:hypothetical protein
VQGQTESSSHSWQNSSNPYDVDASGEVTLLDILALVNYLNEQRKALHAPTVVGTPSLYYDVSGDGLCTVIDVLLVIDSIEATRGPSGEGEGSTCNPQLSLCETNQEAEETNPALSVATHSPGVYGGSQELAPQAVGDARTHESPSSIPVPRTGGNETDIGDDIVGPLAEKDLLPDVTKTSLALDALLLDAIAEDVAVAHRAP